MQRSYVEADDLIYICITNPPYKNISYKWHMSMAPRMYTYTKQIQ